MKTPFTRWRARQSMLGGCVLGVLGATVTSGCTRELTGLTFEVLPQDAAGAVVSDAALTDAANSDTELPDSPTLDATVEGNVRVDAHVELEAGQRRDEAGVEGTQEPTSDALDASGPRQSDTVVADAGEQALDASSDAGERGERWVFGVATPFERGDAGLGLVPVLPAVAQFVDGSNGEWSEAGWLRIETPDMSIGQPLSERDLSAALAVRWDASKLYLAVTVADQHHVNEASGFDIWGGDSIQVAFDVGQGRLPYDWEYGFAMTSRGMIAHRWREGDADLSTDMDFAVVRHSGVTVYEVAFEPRHLGIDGFPIDALRLSVAVNDNDGQERSAALELVQGIVGTKSAAQFASTDWR